MKHSLHTLPLSNSFAQAPGTFYSRMRPMSFEQPAELIHFNTAAACDPACGDIFSSQQLPPPGSELPAQMADSDTDYTEIDRQFKLLQTPFYEHPDMAHYADPPPDRARDIQVSCSS